MIASLGCFTVTSSFAQTATSTIGKFTNLNKGDAAPFEGTLFDAFALAKILADKQQAGRECDLRITYEKKMGSALCKRNTDLLSSEIQIEKKKYNLIVSAQQQEIESLRKLAKGGDNTLWATIGFALGSITSVAIFFAAVEISK